MVVLVDEEDSTCVVPPGCARILVKLESENPTGSMKDRVALAMIERAEQDGRLKPGDTVVEYTGGSTGPAIALVCRAKGYRAAYCPDLKLDDREKIRLTQLSSKAG